jgi:type IV pilus biogenesis protein CpaD/CtpE
MYRILLVSLVALAACDNTQAPVAADFGNSVNSNIAAQVVNPQPATLGPVTSDGQRAGNAIDRYRNNEVYPPHLPLETGRIYGGYLQQPPPGK